MKKFLLFSCLLLSICVFCRAQYYVRQLISPAGDYFVEANIQMTWVLGDLVTGAFNIGQLIVPYGTDVPQDNELSQFAVLYPNPTSDKVYLILSTSDAEKCTYWLYDMLGRKIQNGNIVSDRTELDLGFFDPGMYILRIITEEKLVQEFKIVKQ